MMLRAWGLSLGAVAWSVAVLGVAACGADSEGTPESVAIASGDGGTSTSIVESPDAGGSEDGSPAVSSPSLPTSPVVCPALPKLGGASTSKVPAEWIARNYVDALGRLPTTAEWTFVLASQGTTCNADRLTSVVSLYNGAEFLSLPYTARERSLAMFRGLIGHDPRSDELDKLTAYQEEKPEGLCSAIEFLVKSKQFSDHAATICSTSVANYHFEKGFPAIGSGDALSESELRSKLKNAASGDVVELPRGAYVELKSSLVVPSGVTLRTAGMGTEADRKAYARLARLTRGVGFGDALVQLEEGAHIEALWLDGRVGDFASDPDTSKLGPNVFTEPTVKMASSVRYIRSENPSGAQNIRIGSYAGKVCTKEMLVEGNLATNSGNDNRAGGARPIWSDGIFVHCETSLVKNNEVLDPSDVGLILFVSENGEQHSSITSNRVLSAGNDAFGGLVIDTWTGFRCKFTPCDFSNAGFSDNTLWSGPNTRFVFAISTASSPWSFIPGHGTARGASFLRNTSGSARIRTQVAFYGAHLLDATVSSNWNGTLIDFVGPAGSVPLNTCPIGATLVEAATTSGSFQSSVPGSRTDCI